MLAVVESMAFGTPNLQHQLLLVEVLESHWTKLDSRYTQYFTVDVSFCGLEASVSASDFNPAVSVALVCMTFYFLCVWLNIMLKL